MFIHPAQNRVRRSNGSQIGKYFVKIRELIEAETLVVARNEYRDQRGVLIGTTERIGNRIEARNRIGRLVGVYDIENNVTRNWNGVKVGTGDILTSLFLTLT